MEGRGAPKPPNDLAAQRPPQSSVAWLDLRRSALVAPAVRCSRRLDGAPPTSWRRPHEQRSDTNGRYKQCQGGSESLGGLGARPKNQEEREGDKNQRDRENWKVVAGAQGEVDHLERPQRKPDKQERPTEESRPSDVKQAESKEGRALEHHPPIGYMARSEKENGEYGDRGDACQPRG